MCLQDVKHSPAEGQRREQGGFHKQVLRCQAGEPKADTGCCSKICGTVPHFSGRGCSTDTFLSLALLLIVKDA